MIDLIKTILLGIVEGITEFLPISSTGHLIVAAALLDFTGARQETFVIFIQLGAVVAVVLFYWRDLLQQIRTVRSDHGVQQLWLGVLIAFLPAAVVGVLLRGVIKSVLFTPVTVAVSLIVGGIVLIALERRLQTGASAQAETAAPIPVISLRQAVVIGAAQTLALIPGVSRAASSIIGGMLSGLSRPAATRFSFYLAIPTLGLATIADLVLSLDELNSSDLFYLLIGAIVSGVVAGFAIRWLLRYIERHTFVPFGIYRIGAGVVILLLAALSVI
ncbi:undecaprenyl-diphosphate phosphatase [Anaerolineae bacterium CFX9]|nr:undecaprenyl-diphosphate phosphatase [Anaerolineae bacterium CFX9]